MLRVVTRTAKSAQPVARLVAGDRFDPGTGVVTVGAEPAVLTFQVIASLDPSMPVLLQVLDARTGIELLPRTKVPVVAAVDIDEGWL